MSKSYFDKYVKYKNKFLNLRKQIEEFNLILDDRKTFGFIDPKNKNKYLSLRDRYLNLFRAEPYQFLRNRDGEAPHIEQK